MYNHSRVAGILGCVAALTIAGCSAGGGVAPTAGSATQSSARDFSFSAGWIHKDGIIYHVPHYMVTRGHEPQVKADIVLTYYGGPVQVTPTVYLIFWNYTKYGDSHGVKSLLENYISSMGGSGHNNIYTQYFEKSRQQDHLHHESVEPVRRCLGRRYQSVPSHPTDAQVAAEALKGVAHFGYNANGSYVVATPHGHSTSGFGTQWCAYHSATTSDGKLVSYTNLPYMPDAGAQLRCQHHQPAVGRNRDRRRRDDRRRSRVGRIGHRSESAHRLVQLQQGEIGDICAWQNIQNDPFRTNSYTMQPMFSNATQSCVHSY